MTLQSSADNSFPDTDEALAAKAQTGDRKAVTELIGRYRPFVAMIASHYFGASMETDDMIQEGLIGLLSAVYSYSAVRNASFKTYCAACVTNSIRSAVKANAGRKNAPLNSSVPLDDVDLTAGASPEQIVLADEKALYIKRLIGTKLSAMESAVLKQHLNGADYRTAAAALGLTEKAVDNALQRVRNKLSEALDRY